MNTIPLLSAFVEQKLPSAVREEQINSNPANSSWLDVELNGRCVAIEASPKRGIGLWFGLTTDDPAESSFCGPDALVSTPEEAEELIVAFLVGGKRTMAVATPARDVVRK